MSVWGVPACQLIKVNHIYISPILENSPFLNQVTPTRLQSSAIFRRTSLEKDCRKTTSQQSEDQCLNAPSEVVNGRGQKLASQPSRMKSTPSNLWLTSESMVSLPDSCYHIVVLPNNTIIIDGIIPGTRVQRI